MTVRVLISDKMDPKAAAIFRERGIEVDEKPGLTPDELAAIIGDYQGLAIRSATKVTKPLLDHAKKLKVVGRAGIVMLSTDGVKFLRVLFPDLSDLRSITAVDAREATVTTTDGRVFVTVDGGENWELKK